MSEIYEGIHFSWKHAKIIIEEMLKFYGNRMDLFYISNRINSYSIEPQAWINFDKEYGLFSEIIIVAYTKKKALSIVLERLFSTGKINEFSNLSDSIEYVLKKLKAIFFSQPFLTHAYS